MPTLSEIDSENIWHPFTPLDSEEPPILIAQGSGIYLITPDGRKIIDAISSWWVNLHGHSNPVIAAAVAAQAQKLEQVIFAGFTHEPAIRLSENLLGILPANQKKIFFSDNGSTAVEVGLKMALQYWHNQKIRKQRVVAIEGGYHGDTFGAMSVGGRSIFTDPFADKLFDVSFIPFPAPGHQTDSLKRFKELTEDGTVAAFIFEPLLQGAAGMRMYKPEILDEMLAMATEREVITIADEVLTGFGRTGKNFASDYLAIAPDIIALSKGITGGTLPLGVTSCSGKISSAFAGGGFETTFFHGHSYTANPLSCAAANASFNLLMKPDCQERIKRIGELHREFMTSIKTNPKVKDARCTGTILAIELHTKEQSSYSNPARTNIYAYFMERDILLRPLGNVFYIMPPYVIGDQELAKVYDAIRSFLKD